MFESMMKWTLGLLAVGCVLALVGPAAADFTPKNSADFDWKYEMDVEPSVADLDTNSFMDFTEVNEAGSIIEPGILTMALAAGDCAYYANIDANQTWQLDSNISFANGYTFEVRAKLTSTAPRGFCFYGCPGPDQPVAWLNLQDGGQNWGDLGDPEISRTDNSDDFHVFRVAQKPGEGLFSVWRDGELLTDALPCATGVGGADQITFGDFGYAYGGTIEIEYLRFTSGAWAPDDAPPPPIPGDANLDKIVNDADASILAAHWQQSGAEIGWGDGDFDGNNIVNDADASILAAHWQETQEGAAPVPEPSVLVLLFGAGLIGLLARARRRR